jgi:hypothetical protein
MTKKRKAAGSDNGRIEQFPVRPAIQAIPEAETDDRHTAPRPHTGVRNPHYRRA